MDSLTHVCLGVCTGEILLSKKLGKKALLWGALAQNLPDIDTFAAFFVSPDKDLVIHRAITHSLFFAVVVGLLLAVLTKAVHRKRFMSFGFIAFFFIFQLVLHDLIDTCNSYGTELLAPFNHHRFSINLLYVADPLFTLSMFAATIFLIFKNSSNKKRGKWALTAICISIIYLFFAGINKIYINKRVEAAFRAKQIHPADYFTTPAPLTSMLWYVVAAADSAYYTTYTSVWDDKRQPLEFEKYQKNYSLLNGSIDKDVLSNLTNFAGGYHTITKLNGILYFNILRFEQVQGWRINNAPFAFSYPLVSGRDQYMLLQKGRLTGWDGNSIKIYFERIAGKQTLTKTQ